MEQKPYLQVYKASAGSGKTFTLAVQYIKHLIADPTAYKRILAVTFTNKATAEMKDRIISQLYGLATEDELSASYMKELMRETGRTATDIRMQAQKALQSMLHDYSRFRIETIDSFFQSVMRNLARELELGARMNIDLNTLQATHDAVDALIERLDKHSPVLHTLIAYLDEQLDENRKWSAMIRSLKSFGMHIFNEAYMEHGHALRQKLSDPTFLKDYQTILYQYRTSIFQEMQGFADRFYKTLEQAGLEPSDLKRKEKGIANYFKRLQNGDLELTAVQTVELCQSNPNEWTSKTSERKDEIIALAAQTLCPLLVEAENKRKKNLPILNSITLSLTYLNDLKLLHAIAEEVHQQNREKNRFLLADTNALLHQLMHEGDASFIYEKIGTTIDRVMIDEFQDTSRLQWENFRLLIEESLSQREGSLIVGDIKQSIYRWRNGDWKILAQIDNQYGLRVNIRTLARNWRSEQRIVHFNNVFFPQACTILNHQYQDELKHPCNPLLHAYEDVIQESARHIEQGYVQIALTTPIRTQTYLELSLELLRNEVERLVEAGVKPNEIAILIRHKKYFPALASYFNQHTPYKLVSNEAFYLSSSLAVSMLVDALAYVADSTDRRLAARLVMVYQQNICGHTIDTGDLLLEDLGAYFPPTFNKRLPELQMLPLYELCETLYHIFSLDRIKKEDAYVCSFFDLLLDFTQQTASDIPTFITHWEETLSGKSIPSGEIDGIRMLTIHASKGLEFHTVLIPFCDWSLETDFHEHLIWCETTPDTPPPFSNLELTPLNYSSSMKDSVYKAAYYNEKVQLWIDNLNLLYVGFTRACKNLLIFGQVQKNTVAEIIKNAIDDTSEIPFKKSELNHSSTDDLEPPTTTIHTWGTIIPSRTQRVHESKNCFLASPQSFLLNLESTQPTVSFKQSNQSARFIEGDETTDYLQQGKLLHRLFECIRTPEDLPDALRRLTFEGLIDSDRQCASLEKLMRKALSHPIASQWFTPDWTLYNECTILYQDEEGHTVTRRPDRVMRRDNQVVVVDFKFGIPHEDYHRQVGQYLELMQRMGYQAEGYIWYVYTHQLVKVANN